MIMLSRWLHTCKPVSSVNVYEFLQDTVYEYYVDTKNKCWASFEDKLPKGWRYNAS